MLLGKHLTCVTGKSYLADENFDLVIPFGLKLVDRVADEVDLPPR